jgi:hypothetical protein
MASILESLYKQFGSQNAVFISVAGPWQSATGDDAAKFIHDHGSIITALEGEQTYDRLAGILAQASG